MSQESFKKLLLRAANRTPDEDGGAGELVEVEACMRRVHSTIVDAFDTYGAAGSGNPFAIQLNSYSDFLDDCAIEDQDSASCKGRDLDTIFILSNVEADKKSEESKVNEDRALMRWEFVEAVVRIALAKYGYCGDHDRDDPAKTADPSEAIQRLIDINIIPHLGPEAAVDSNEFRKNRLYNEEVDTVLKDHLKMLRSLFKGACGLKRGSKETRMSVSEPVKSTPRHLPRSRANLSLFVGLLSSGGAHCWRSLDSSTKTLRSARAHFVSDGPRCLWLMKSRTCSRTARCCSPTSSRRWAVLPT